MRCCRARPSPSSAAPSTTPSPRRRARSCAPSSIASTAATSISAPRKGQEPTGTDWPGYFKGKTIAVGPFGGTPNSITRYLLGKWKLDAKKDVTLVETANSATIAVVRSKQAQIGEATEPFVTQGMRNNVWGEPFFNVPKELGPYAYSTINVRLDTIQKEPGAGAQLRARHGQGPEVRSMPIPAKPARSPRRNFRPCRSTTCSSTLDRSFKDEMWSRDGMVSRRPGRPRAPWCAKPASQERHQIRRDHRHELRRRRMRTEDRGQTIGGRGRSCLI